MPNEEKEHPIVANRLAPGALGIGDYVFASLQADCDPAEPWAVGHVSEIGDYFVVVGDVSNRQWPRAMRITHAQGRRIAEKYPLMDDPAGHPLDYKAIADAFGLFTN